MGLVRELNGTEFVICKMSNYEFLMHNLALRIKLGHHNKPVNV